MTIRISEASVTRPNNTDAYTAGDAIGTTPGDAMEFAAEQFGFIRGACLIDSAAEATKPDIDLFLFDKEPAVANDNAAFIPTDAEMESFVGVISFLGSAFKVGLASGNGVIQLTSLDIAYCAPRKLWGVLIARNAYVPISGEKFRVRLSMVLE